MGEYNEVFKRTEIKYLLNEKQFESLFPFMETLARVDRYGLSRINNIYYDTPDYRLIRTSLEKPRYKEKLRLRTYGETHNNTNSFIEIKKKYDGIVYKRRVSGKYLDAFEYMSGRREKLDDSQISGEIDSFIRYYKTLIPAMTICYDRIAMAGIDDESFRVTFDTNITWNDRCLDLRWVDRKDMLVPGNRGKQILENGNYMMEIKVTNAMPMELSRVLSELEIFPASFSKYGRGYQEMMKDMIRKESVTYRPGVQDGENVRKGAVAYV